MAVFRALLGLREGLSPASSQLSRETKHIYFTRRRLHGTFVPNNASALGSVICIHKDLVLDGAVISHVITCQGRDHIVTIQSGDCVFVVVNVHFEPVLTLRSLRERLHLITPHWPCYPGTFREPEEGRFSVWNQNFTDGDAVKTVLFPPLFPARSGNRTARLHKEGHYCGWYNTHSVQN